MTAVRNLLCAAGAMVLSGCMGSAVPESNPGGDDTRARAGLAAFFARSGGDDGPRQAPLARVSLAGGDVVVAGPEGYCIDPATRRRAPERGFAVIASCHILSDGKAGRDVAPMLVTVTVGPRGGAADLPTPEALAQAAGVRLLDGRSSAAHVSAQLASGGDKMFDGSDKRYWRAVFVQGDRLVGLALYAPRGSALSGSKGAQMLVQVRSKIAEQSRSAASATVRKPVAGATSPRKLLGGLFTRKDPVN